MKKSYLWILLILFGCTQPTSITQFTIENNTDLQRKEVITIDVSKHQLNVESFYGVKEGDNVLNAEWRDVNSDGMLDQLLVQVSMAPQSSKVLQLMMVDEPVKVPKLTQAEISIKEGGEWQGREYLGGSFKNVERLDVPPEHTDHSWFIRYEGPGWESDLVGYRFYLDWRNGVDIFGKTTNEMVLQDIGQDGFDSYHEMNDWGLDILKVGSSLGLGSIGRYGNDTLYRFQEVETISCDITRNGLLESVIATTYNGWRTEDDIRDITSELSIQAGSRVTRHKLNLYDPLEGFCTGLVINPDEQVFNFTEGNFRVIATYGLNSLNQDSLGMAVIVRHEDVETVFDDEFSHVIVFKPTTEITYHFLAAWEKESEGITNSKDFESYLDQILIQLNQPLELM